MSERAELARSVYAAFAAGDRDAVERLLAEDFSFHSPVDPSLDRLGYFERCWPHSGSGSSFHFQRVIENGDEVVVTYESEKGDGRRVRNTEVLTFNDEKIAAAEVYFGWNVE